MSLGLGRQKQIGDLRGGLLGWQAADGNHAELVLEGCVLLVPKCLGRLGFQVVYLRTGVVLESDVLEKGKNRV